MRHTLLPLQERRLLRKEYRIRAIIVFLFMLSAAGLAGVIIMLPGFIKTYSEEKTATDKVASLKREKNNAVHGALENNTAFLEKLLASFGKEDSQIKGSAIINNIIGMRDSLRITSISVTASSPTSISTVIQGVAPTRNALLSFKSRFESVMPGNKVDLPVSQLGKSSNLSFSLQLKQQLQ